MKVSEFEAKLGTVSDAKLRQMLASGREHGPEVAVKLILAEYRKRGMEDGESAAGSSEVPLESMATSTSAYPKEVAGAFGSDAPAEASTDAAMPALSPEWLSEETKSGMPVAIKALLTIVFIVGVLALAWKFSH